MTTTLDVAAMAVSLVTGIDAADFKQTVLLAVANGLIPPGRLMEECPMPEATLVGLLADRAGIQEWAKAGIEQAERHRAQQRAESEIAKWN